MFIDTDLMQFGSIVLSCFVEWDTELASRHLFDGVFIVMRAVHVFLLYLCLLHCVIEGRGSRVKKK